MTILWVWSFRSKALDSLPVFRWVLGVLNLASILALIVLAWNPSRVHLTEYKAQNTLLVCFDTSESMSVADPLQTRLDHALTVFDQHFVNTPSDRPRCRWASFDSRFRTLARGDLGQQWGSRSDLEVALARLSDRVQADREGDQGREPSLSGVVIFTDGQVDNKQVTSYAKLPSQDCPVMIVACGHDTPLKDVCVRSVTAPIAVRADQRYDIVAQVTAQQLDRQPIEVELWINEVLTDRTTLVALQDNEPQDVSFSAYALTPGIDEVTVRAAAVYGESNVSNNVRTRLVDIQADTGLRVLLYTQVASFDIGRIRQCLSRDLRVQLEFAFDAIMDPNLLKEQTDQADQPRHFPDTAVELNQYDLIVLGPCRFDQFSAKQIAELYDFVTKRGGSVVFLPGREPFALDQCDIEKIRTLIPVTFDETAAPKSTRGLRLTPEGRDQQYSESVCDDKPRGQDIDAAYGSAKKKPAAFTALTCGENPLVCTQRLGRGKTAIINSRNLYQLYREDQTDGPLFNLLRDIVTDVGEQPSRQSHIEVFVRRGSDKTDLIFEASVTDQDFAAAHEATVLLEFNDRITRMTEAWPGTYMVTIPEFQGTSVFARVRVEHRDVYLGEKMIAAELDAVRHEMDDTRCDKAFLRTLCEYVGARYMDANQIEAHSFDQFEPYHMAHQAPELQSIWPRWGVFVFLCMMLFLQWFLRRAKGLV
ncbi:MAG: hypothetical protein K9N55_02840 [Phycisphaerae bacterium]|nr:hypothetical protein [Phycisphaerae bacterium]